MAMIEVVSPRMIVIDDIEENRDILARNFQRRGFDVSQAGSGQDGLSLIDACPFDIVMLDIMMPAMCGLDVLRNIRQRFSAGKLPVIMVTARSEEENIAEAIELGANDYITKPVNVPIAYARVMSQLERKRAEEALERSMLKMTATVRQLELEIWRSRQAEARRAI